MQNKTLFKLFHNKVKGIIITTMSSFVNGNYTYSAYLCYTENNKLFSIIEETITYPETVDCESYGITSYHMGEVLSNNTIIPEFDVLFKDNIYYTGINLD